MALPVLRLVDESGAPRTPTLKRLSGWAGGEIALGFGTFLGSSSLAPDTVKNYGASVELFAGWIKDRKPSPSEVSTHDVVRFLNRLPYRNYRTVTATGLRRFFGWLADT